MFRSNTSWEQQRLYAARKKEGLMFRSNTLWEQQRLYAARKKEVTGLNLKKVSLVLINHY